MQQTSNSVSPLPCHKPRKRVFIHFHHVHSHLLDVRSSLSKPLLYFCDLFLSTLVFGGHLFHLMVVPALGGSNMLQRYRHVPKRPTPVLSLFSITHRLRGSSEPGGSQRSWLSKTGPVVWNFPMPLSMTLGQGLQSFFCHISYYTTVRGQEILWNDIAWAYVTFYQINKLSLISEKKVY